MEHGWRLHNQYGLTKVNIKRRFSKYKPFILAQQAQQVYYAKYLRKKIKSQKKEKVDWLAICKIKAKGMIDAQI